MSRAIHLISILLIFVLSGGSFVHAASGAASAGFDDEWDVVAQHIDDLSLGQFNKIALKTRLRAQLRANSNAHAGAIPTERLTRLLTELSKEGATIAAMADAAATIDLAARLEKTSAAARLESAFAHRAAASEESLSVVAEASATLIESLRVASRTNASVAVDIVADIASTYTSEWESEAVAEILVAIGERAETSGAIISLVAADIRSAMNAGAAAAEILVKLGGDPDDEAGTSEDDEDHTANEHDEAAVGGGVHVGGDAHVGGGVDLGFKIGASVGIHLGGHL